MKLNEYFEKNQYLKKSYEEIIQMSRSFRKSGVAIFTLE